jgi:hypothetical protein
VRIFLSHASSDHEFAGQIAKSLQGAGYDVWWDVEAVSAGDNVAETVGKELNRADAIVALVSPDALRSSYVLKEWEYAFGQQRFAGNLFPIEVKPTKNAPWILEKLNMIRAPSSGAASKQLLAALSSPKSKSRDP